MKEIKKLKKSIWTGENKQQNKVILNLSYFLHKRLYKKINKKTILFLKKNKKNN